MDDRTGPMSRTAESSVWHQMISGMRAYGVAVTLVWALAATSLLILFAAVASSAWLRAALGGAAVAELGFSMLTVVFLRHALRSGRFDV